MALDDLASRGQRLAGRCRCGWLGIAILAHDSGSNGFDRCSGHFSHRGDLMAVQISGISKCRADLRQTVHRQRLRAPRLDEH